ncbi:MAG: LPS-assembly protein [Rickettsiales bacterium]|jgi:LPS-assembly protein
MFFLNLTHKTNLFGKNLSRRTAKIFLLEITLIFACTSVFAKNQEPEQNSLPAILKADNVDGDREKNTLNAVGNVELIKNGSTIFADKISYNKKGGDISALGNIKIINYDIGNILANKADIKSDLKSGKFNEATVVFLDGSYIESPEVTRKNESETIFSKPIFSICPNADIEENNLLAGEKRDAISITSSETTINKETNSIKTKDGVIRIYNIPVFYTPYLSMPLPASERKSGFLHPSYTQSNNLGLGFQAPYYFNISPDKDLISTVQYHPIGQHILLDNKYRQLLKSGEYNINLELANNKPKSGELLINGENIDNNDQNIRWKGLADGNLSLSKNWGADFNINVVGDKNYLRDYHNEFTDNTVSEANLDYIKDRNYGSIKTVGIQELDVDSDEREAPLALPIINYLFTSKPQGGTFNQTYLALFNSTIITRESGLQYRRASFKPEIKVPYNLVGNLFEFSANLQGDIYNTDSNFADSSKDSNFKSTTTNYRPEANAKWSLPLVGKYQTSTIIIEPLANIAISSYANNFNGIPNEDSNDVELTQSNLFLSDRFNGFDRNEDGARASYGFKSSLFNDNAGQFNFGLGQSIRGKSKKQDVVIRGFGDDNKSNIVGEFSYKSPKIFSFTYSFQLNETNYRNDVNEIGSSLDFERFNIAANYIFIRKTATNLEKKEQLNTNIGFRITKKLLANLSDTRDLVEGRVISRIYGLNYQGCCVVSSLYVSEDNPTAFSTPQRSFGINFTIKNL